MVNLLSSLLVLRALAASPAAALAPADSVGAAGACAPLARAAASSPRVAGDVWRTLALHGGAVRWDTGRGPLRLWVQPRPLTSVSWEHPRADWHLAVVGAAAAWRDRAVGVAFQEVRDSASATVIVTWADALAGPAEADAGRAVGRGSATGGRTALVAAPDGRARAAHVRLTMFDPAGLPLAVSEVRTIARHELGHVLGLAHHAAPESVMAPVVRAQRLSPGDRAALRLLYALPPGARCAAPRAPAAR